MINFSESQIFTNSFWNQKLYNFSKKLMKRWSIKLFGEQ